MSSAVTSARRSGFWAGIRLVVVDTETTVPPDSTLRRAVQVAAVTCRNGHISTTWSTLLDPGCPVDEHSFIIHDISVSDLDGAPTFQQQATELNRHLTGDDQERVIFVAHNVGFDVSVLRHEYQLTGTDIADIPVLDTKGRLATAVGVYPAGGSLPALADALDITYQGRRHDALNDARTCALVAIELVNRAADTFPSFDALYATISGKTTRDTRAGSRHRTRGARTRPPLPDEHLASHTKVLAANAGTKAFAAWATAINECASLRCPHLTSRVRAARPKAERLLQPLQNVIDELASAGDTAGTATVLAAYLDIIDHRPALTGRAGRRRAHLATAKHLTRTLGELGRCGPDDQCPDCTSGAPCPLDTWPRQVATLALGELGKGTVASFMSLTGVKAGKGVWATWVSDRVDDRVIDAALSECCTWWLTTDNEVTANLLAQQAVAAGRHHPELTSLLANNTAKRDIEGAIKLCAATLEHRNNSTDDSWDALDALRQRLIAYRDARGRPTKNGDPYLRRTARTRTPHRSRFRPWDSTQTAASNA